MNEERERLVKKLGETPPGTESYYELLRELQLVDAILRENKPKRWFDHPLVPTAISAGTTLVFGGLALNFERANVITSRMFGWIPKPRL